MPMRNVALRLDIESVRIATVNNQKFFNNRSM